MKRDRQLSNTIIDTTRSAGPKRRPRARNSNGSTLFVCVIAGVSLLYFLSRMH